MPLSVDMSLEQLKKYQGSSKKPDDFDEYWEDILKKRKFFSGNIEMKRNGFQTPFCECYDIFFHGIEEAAIHVKYLKPRNTTGKIPAIIEFHGYGGCSKDWTYKLPYAACGIAVFSMECRGQMGDSTDSFGVQNHFRNCNLIRGVMTPEDLYYKKVFLDALDLMDIVMEFDDININKIGTMGYSQGGGIALALAALNTNVNKVFAVYPFLSDYKRCWDMDTGAAYEEIKDYFRQRDPQHERENEFFNNLGYIDIQNMAHWIKADVVMTTGLMDKVCPPSTQFAVYNKLLCRKKHLIFPEYGHEDMLNGLQDENLKWAMELL
ncbi:acetylxylan esterase [Fusobacterium varium]|uniref:acetylxylan esterase n=1 Tax=Fusobacterium varium TaxID=856 RepID=UPI0027DD9C1F|nr:acetylxylan esterase [uncultured Fusobacterium sp.]